MKTALSLASAGMAILVAFPMTAQAQDFDRNITASSSEIMLASSTRPAFHHQQRLRYRYATGQRYHRHHRQHRYRRYRC